MKVFFVASTFVFLGLIIWRAQAIRCYQCVSYLLNENSNCENSVTKIAPEECPTSTNFGDYVNIKVKYSPLIDFGMVYRSCGNDSSWLRQNVAFDKTINIVTFSYRSCDTNLCNGDSWDKSVLWEKRTLNRSSASNFRMLSILNMIISFFFVYLLQF